MNDEEIIVNRHAVSLKLCEQIRQNNNQLIKATNYTERPYRDGEKKYKFNTANYLRILSSERNYSDPRWYEIEDIQINQWTLKTNATPELLEESCRDEAGENEYFLREFYNAEDINESKEWKQQNQTLEEVLDFLIVRDILEKNCGLISLQDGVEAVKKYAAGFYEDELIEKLTAQMWLVESKLKTKFEIFMPKYTEENISEIKKEPECIFQKMNQANEILKKLRKERVKPIMEEVPLNDMFQELKIIYHGSEEAIIDKTGCEYPQESILTGITAYKFLSSWREKCAGKKFKTWIEVSYKDYEHGKVLLTNEENEDLNSGILKKRLDKNRREVLDSPQELSQYFLADTEGKISEVEILNLIKSESEKFQRVMKEFETEELEYLEKISAM